MKKSKVGQAADFCTGRETLAERTRIARTMSRLWQSHKGETVRAWKKSKTLPDKIKPAYTLSEVILVIGIIGIVAALTIPQLVQNSNNKELVSAFLKSNNVLANAYKNAKAIDNIHKMAPTEFKQTFKKYLKTVDCENHDICLQDGMYVDFTCNETTCTELTVNTNGDKKPNQAGKDRFNFTITQDTIIPNGKQEHCSGLDCGMYTLTYHKIFDTLIPNCAMYDVNTGKCKTCEDGYKQEHGECSQIEMLSCTKFKGENCIACKTGYILSGTNCVHKYAEIGATYVSGLDKYVLNAGSTSSWDNAKTICTQKDMDLPDINTLMTVYNYRGQAEIPTASNVWSSTEHEYVSEAIYVLVFSNGNPSYTSKNSSTNNWVLCIGEP